MAMIEIKTEPSTTELRVFAALWLMLWLFLGFVAATRPDALVAPGVVAGACLVLSLALNRDVKGRERAWGLGFPLVLLAAWGLGHAALPAVVPVSLAGAFGVVGLCVVLASRAWGNAVYRGWMLAAMPIGWVLSHAMLLAVFFGVVTPVGLLMRAAGRDPMDRRFPAEGGSLWTRRRAVERTTRYFRQS